ncbi:hypothetical protein UA08_00454 [Talaromyces atroroseus]|uniref:Major facilitator superfamily (MFS) profile domain-containing protein n=1 Tax=Talaromyces atroroseus TaxID=1441469 RepID=A0A225AQU3_TALAT|nr:hypothetical protein UA08_00454 [Talaromyces atroroseus]OKL63982.1 hypothetical protein UA08_00454 [Talaromyces atroroseus]
MLKHSPTGTWMPAWVPESTAILSVLLTVCSMVQSATGGYDGSMLNGLNILPSYTDYFNLNAATTGLNTASVFIGSFFGTLSSGITSDKLGRRPAILWGSVITLIGIILQTAAQDIAMFVVARIVLGFGTAISGTAGAVYLAETFPSRWRAWGVGLLNDFYYVGALIAAGVTLGTGKWNSTWAWRVPSLLQGIFSFACIIILPFIPESPRWLVHQGYHEEARIVVAQTNTNGNQADPVALAVYKEILDTLTWEKNQGRTMSPRELIKTPGARKRMLIGISPGPFSCVAGNVIASYYLGSELDTAGITNKVSQLKANVVLNAWCLVCALVGTHLAARWGRFLLHGLDTFVVPIPPGGDELLNPGKRLSLVRVFADCVCNIGWKMYMVNGSWDIVIFLLIAVYWVETKGKTLEEIDAIFEGEKHSSVPDVELVRQGKETIDIGEVEQQIVAEVLATTTDKGNAQISYS